MEVIIFTDINGKYGFGRNLGAYTIASYLRQKGVTVQVVDFFSSLSYETIKNIIDKYVDKNTRLVCFSNTFFQIEKIIKPTPKLNKNDRFIPASYFPFP
jgi:lambda repressor-like predicted transcriptional regulator